MCPHCNRPGISTLRRAFLGPALPAKCRNCGRRVGVPFARSFVVIMPPVFAALIAYEVFQYPTWIHIAVLIGLCLILTPISFRLIPLVKR